MRALLLAALALVGAGQATEDVWQITLRDGTIVWDLRLDSLRRDIVRQIFQAHPPGAGP